MNKSLVRKSVVTVLALGVLSSVGFGVAFGYGGNIIIGVSGGGGGAASGGGGGGSSFPNPGQVLGASTSTITQNTNVVIPPTPVVCSKYLNLPPYLGIGKSNNAAQVKLLQSFLNENLSLNIPLTGFFGPMTLAAVNAFQVKYAAHILSPLGLTSATGFVGAYTTTEINVQYCNR